MTVVFVTRSVASETNKELVNVDSWLVSISHAHLHHFLFVVYELVNVLQKLISIVSHEVSLEVFRRIGIVHIFFRVGVREFFLLEVLVLLFDSIDGLLQAVVIHGSLLVHAKYFPHGTWVSREFALGRIVSEQDHQAVFRFLRNINASLRFHELFELLKVKLV